MTTIRATLAALLAAAFLIGGASVAVAAEPTHDVSGTVRRQWARDDSMVKLWFVARPTPEYFTEGARLHWRVRVDGMDFLALEQGAGNAYKLKVHLGQGRHRVAVWKNGERVRDYLVY